MDQTRGGSYVGANAVIGFRRVGTVPMPERSVPDKHRATVSCDGSFAEVDAVRIRRSKKSMVTIMISSALNCPVSVKGCQGFILHTPLREREFHLWRMTIIGTIEFRPGTKSTWHEKNWV